MDQNSELMNIISGNFGWNKARVTCFVNMLVALLITGTVNLTKIARAMPGNAEQESRYQLLTKIGFNRDLLTNHEIPTQDDIRALHALVCSFDEQSKSTETAFRLSRQSMFALRPNSKEQEANKRALSQSP